MGTKGKKKKDIVTLLDKEEQDVRYDIIKNSLRIIVKCLFGLSAVWCVVLMVNGYGKNLIYMLREVMAVPVVLLVAADLFELCFDRFKLQLHDWTVLLIINSVTLLILAGDHWTRSMTFLNILPVIFCMILKDVRLVYFQMVLSVVMVIADYVFIEMCTDSRWKDNMLLNLLGSLYAMIVTARLTVQIRKYTHMLNIQSEMDSLTRLHNHEAFYRKLDDKIDEYKKSGKPLCILIADIDNFKKVNDTYGHAYGDKVLKALAGIFLEEESSRCFAARYGGEEFSMIMNMSREDAITKAQIIRTRFEQQQIPMENGQVNSFTVSIGVAVCRPEFLNSRQFFEKADEAMYRAKAGGKNRVCL